MESLTDRRRYLQAFDSVVNYVMDYRFYTAETECKSVKEYKPRKSEVSERFHYCFFSKMSLYFVPIKI